MRSVPSLMFTCEHGGNGVPRRVRRLFAHGERLLRSHRAYDPGALELARFLARKTATPLIASTTTRLVVDLNRSPTNSRVFSEVTRVLDRSTRVALLDEFHAPHWSQVRRAVERRTRGRGTVLHVAVHSFVPQLDGVHRSCDVGLLYDPQRRPERDFCASWREQLRRHSPQLRVRRNYPYRGSDDGLTTAMRARFGAARYLGVELEVNQKWWRAGGSRWDELQWLVLQTLRASLASYT